ncbi:hypothetical protein ZEAMMB73_Zm00001d000025 [Zea mays]|jgi:homeobox-leucine zipper protein|nr:hypothetical protein ZEAMMB73_Zm00001d000025 [Zea mays]
MNRAPAGKAPGGSCSEDEEPGASSPNSTLISSLSEKRAAPARSGEEVGPEADHTRRAGGSGSGSDDEDCVAGARSRKKLRLSKDHRPPSSKRASTAPSTPYVVDRPMRS